MFMKTDKTQETKPTSGPQDILPVGVAAPAGRAPSRGASIISAELKVVGNLICTGDLQVDGAVEGDVESRSLTVGESARIKGALAAETILISGNVQGAVRAATVRLTRTARVTGDVTYKSLSVEDGGVLNGNCVHDARAETGASAYRQPQAVAAVGAE